MSCGERSHILSLLHSERFCDAAPAQVWATLLDEGVYLGSESTFYRLLRTAHGDVRERRSQATHPAQVKPELVAHGPNQVWSCYAEIVVMPMVLSDVECWVVAGAGRSA